LLFVDASLRGLIITNRKHVSYWYTKWYYSSQTFSCCITYITSGNRLRSL